MDDVAYLLVEVNRVNPKENQRICMIALEKSAALEWEMDSSSSPEMKRESVPVKIYKPKTTTM